MVKAESWLLPGEGEREEGGRTGKNGGRRRGRGKERGKEGEVKERRER